MTKESQQHPLIKRAYILFRLCKLFKNTKYIVSHFLKMALFKVYGHHKVSIRTLKLQDKAVCKLFRVLFVSCMAIEIFLED